MESAPRLSRCLRFGIFEADLEACELRKSGMRIKLVGQPFQVLQLLLEHPQQIVTREAMKQRMWPQDTHVDYDLALKRVMNRLREVLGDSAESPRFIETIPRMGYRFIAPVESLGDGAYAQPAVPSAADSIPALPPRAVGRRKWFAVGTILVVSLLMTALGLPRSRSFSRRVLGASNAAVMGLHVLARGDPTPLIYQPLVLGAAVPGKSVFTLTLSGTGFTRDSLVNWNGQARVTTFVSNSQLEAEIRASDMARPGTASVMVVNAKAARGSSNELFFSFGRPSHSVNLAKKDFYVGLEPDSVVVGDFNGDGKLDLAVANPSSAAICILLGNGDGTFHEAVYYAIEQGPFAQLAVGDFNRDGVLDLAVTNVAANNVSVLLGNGDGTFRPRVNYPVEVNPSGVAVADLNGDGNLDLVVSNGNCNTIGGFDHKGRFCAAGTVSVLLGNGDGTFQARKDFAVGHPGNGVTIADFNGDGKLDLAVIGGNAGNAESPAVSILLGNGDGTFQPPIDYGLDTNPGFVVAADFNGDGKLDLAVVDNIGLVSILLGRGDGTFLRRKDYIIGSFPGGSIGVGDFNGDGKLDLAVAESGASSNSIIILFGKGDGTFQALGRDDGYFQAVGARFATGTMPQGVAVGDFNGDGKLDLAIPNRGSSTVTVLLQ